MMTRRASLVLKNVTLSDGRTADISIGSGVVRHVGSAAPCENTIDCAGFLVLPAATDIHVHMRGGVQFRKEDWKTGSRSALAGGVTFVIDQPNTVPPIDTPETMARRIDEARRNSVCHFAINSAVSKKTDPRQMWEAGAMAFGEAFFAPSSFGDMVSHDVLGHFFSGISRLQALVTVHAETVGPGPDNDIVCHERMRDIQGEVDAVRTVERLNRSRCRLHFCHLSSAKAVNAVRGSSVEVTPHHLFLSLESFKDLADTRGKVNPPLRSERERKALLNSWDRIDIIASDHAPHTALEKQAPFSDAPSGIPGVETMMPLLVRKLLDHTISPASLIAKTSVNPALVLGVKKAGFSVGDRADFSIFEKTLARIHADDLHSRCGWTPYEGMPAAFPSKVIMDGSLAFENGEFFPSSPRWFPGNGFPAKS